MFMAKSIIFSKVNCLTFCYEEGEGEKNLELQDLEDYLHYQVGKVKIVNFHGKFHYFLKGKYHLVWFLKVYSASES